MKCILNDFVIHTEMLKYANVDRVRYHDKFVQQVDNRAIRPHFKDAKYINRVRASHLDLSPHKKEKQGELVLSLQPLIVQYHDLCKKVKIKGL